MLFTYQRFLTLCSIMFLCTHKTYLLWIFSGEGDHVLAKAEFDFDGEGEEELSFRAGAVLRLAPKGQQPRVRGWLLGSLDGSTEGIVPANYVKVSAAKLYSVQLLDSFVGADKKCQWGSFSVIPVLGIDYEDMAHY